MDREQVLDLLDQFEVETPSWGYADAGTRYGKFLQPAAVHTIDEKLADAGIVHRYTGCSPKVAVHVQWDFSIGVDATVTAVAAKRQGLRIGSVHPNFFEDQAYKFGSVCNPDESAREHAHRHMMDCISIARAVKGDALSLWFADGTSYPGQDDIGERKERMHGALRQWHEALPSGMKMLIEYKPFEPALYHSDIADWGMAYVFAKDAGPNARVVVDAGHHLPGQNVEHLVAFLIDEEMLGGIHLSDRKYADGDLTPGSIDPYGVFRIFLEVCNTASRGQDVSGISYMVNQSVGLKPKIEGMIQSVTAVQELYAKACLVDLAKLRDAQARMNIIDAEQCLREAFFTDVRPLLSDWRKKRNLDPDPLMAYRASGYEARVAKEREGSSGRS